MKFRKTKLNSKGFGHLELITLLVVVVVISAVGIYVGTHSKSHAESSQISNVYTWGRNISDAPVVVSGLPSSIADVQAANWGGMAIDGSGNVWQWNATANPTAISESGPTNAVSIGEGYFFSAAATSGGQLWTWGQENSVGDLCQGIVNGTNSTPKQVTTINGSVEAVSGGASHLMILMNSGHVKTCGDNRVGQLGNGTYTNSSTPVQVSKLSNIQAISSGDDFSVALDSNGNVWEWGHNQFGQLGNGTTTNSNVPVEVSLPGPVQEVYAGGSRAGTNSAANGSTIALLKNGSVYAWGNNQWGQLGNGTTTNSSVPVLVNVPNGVTFSFVAMSGQSSYGLDSSGNVYAWGDDSNGQLGNGTNNGVATSPELVLTGYSQLSAVADHVVGG